MKPVLLVIAHKGFQPMEYFVTKEVVEAAGIEVKTASDGVGTAFSSITADKALINITLDDVVVDNFSGVFFIGGPGAWEFLNNKKSYRIIREAAEKCQVWGAICISPRILAAAGVLKGRRVTGWNDDSELEEILFEAKAEYVHESVVVDGNLITADGPAAASEFGQAIVELLNTK